MVDFYTAIEKRQYRWQLFQGTRNKEEIDANWQPLVTGVIVILAVWVDVMTRQRAEARV